MSEPVDPVQLEIYRNLFTSIAEEMGTVLRRTAFSSNIKERRDYSCALFDAEGDLVAMGDHMPVHLGAMPLSVEAALKAYSLGPGDVVLLNDPFSGGSHLPDLTMIAPVYEPSDGFTRPLGYIASRAHHSDVGGMSPGSMPLSRDVFQEGIRIPPLRLYRQGRLDRTLLRLLLSNLRTPVEREGDLAAQMGSLRVGEKRLGELTRRRRRGELQRYMKAFQEYSEKRMTEVIRGIPEGAYPAEDFLDDDGVDNREIRIRVTIQVQDGRMRFDFTGSDPQVLGCVNAVRAVTVSCVYYTLRCLAPAEVPSSAGLMRPVEVVLPDRSVVNAEFPAATSGGNVETSQRIVDVILLALAEALPDRIPAASAGSMNNVSLGGVHAETGQPFSYYETVAGGMGAAPDSDGDSAVHTHMTNSLNTPIEVLEGMMPVRVREYRLRYGSGGKGKFTGGDGVIRSLEILEDCRATILSDRRKTAPYGLQGGARGKKGANSLVTRGRSRRLPGKASLELTKGQILVIETPGGGGWGRS